MKTLAGTAVLTMFAAGIASAIIWDGGTFPSAWVYDGLITRDPMGLPPVPNALHFNVGAGYMMASKYFDQDGDAEDLGGERTLIAVPVDVGYAVNQRILVDITFQLLSYSEKWDPDPPEFYGTEYSTAGLGDIWVKGRYIAPLGRFNVGGRLGVKVPIGKVDYFDFDPELGDGQMDIDVAAVGSLYPDKGFAFNGQVGFRYRTEDSNFYVYSEQAERLEIDYKPGLLTYLHLEPGYSLGREYFQVYVPIGFMMTTTVKSGATGVADSNTNGFYAGVAPKYGLDANNTLGVKFLYPIVGTAGDPIYLLSPELHKSVLIGLTYEGYVPL
jgi:hypothetical protein